MRSKRGESSCQDDPEFWKNKYRLSIAISRSNLVSENLNFAQFDYFGYSEHESIKTPLLLNYQV